MSEKLNGTLFISDQYRKIIMNEWNISQQEANTSPAVKEEIKKRMRSDFLHKNSNNIIIIDQCFTTTEQRSERKKLADKE